MEFTHIGWCKEGIHDKVWGLVLVSKSEFGANQYLSFWGRRKAKLQTKLVTCSKWHAADLFEKKLNKGYKEVNIEQLNEVYPEFRDDLEKTAIWATLKL